MKKILKYLFSATLLAGIATGCEKKELLPFYKTGNAPVLSSSSAIITAAPADSAKAAVTFSWTDPEYANAPLTSKYILQLDTAGGNFSMPVSRTVTGTSTISFTGLELNAILLDYGTAFGAASDIKARIISSYSNNNDQLVSNVVTVKATPYKYAFELTASEAGPFAINLGNKDNDMQTFSWSRPNVGNGTFTYNLQYDKAGNDFATVKSTAISNGATTYVLTGAALNKIAQDAGIANDQPGEVEFRIMATLNGKANQTLVSTVKKLSITPTELVSYLYVPGDYQGWNPSEAPRLASLDAESYEGYVNMSSSNGFKLNNSPDWNHTNYGSGGTGMLSADGNAGNLSLPVGYYLLKANTGALTWTATPITTWGVIGDATPNGWGASTPMQFDAANNVWTVTVNFSGSGAFKFRANNGWEINLGGNASALNYGGDNISSPSAGEHVVTLNLSNPLKYSYTIQ